MMMSKTAEQPVKKVKKRIPGGELTHFPYTCRSQDCIGKGFHRLTFFSREKDAEYLTCPKCNKPTLKQDTARVFFVEQVEKESADFRGTDDTDGLPRYWRYSNREVEHTDNVQKTTEAEACNDYESLVNAEVEVNVLE